MIDSTLHDKMVEVLAAHSLSTADETCCSCGEWLGRRDLGPVEFQHRDHIADALMPLLTKKIEMTRGSEARYRLAWLSARRRAVRGWLNYAACEGVLDSQGEPATTEQYLFACLYTYPTDRPLPKDCLWCDGATLDPTDYPELANLDDGVLLNKEGLIQLPNLSSNNSIGYIIKVKETF
jgi:hypothetical protein